MIRQRRLGPRLAMTATFALSCVGLLLFLWLQFGGPIPLQPKPYEVKVPFPHTIQLSKQAEIRVSGVPIGKVSDLRLMRDGQVMATLAIDAPYAPLRRDVRAILRQKTLQGETYVELTPGGRGSPALPEGAQVPAAQVAPSVQLDEIFRGLNARTRASLRIWMQELAVGVEGRGQDLSDALGNLPSLAGDGDDLLRTLVSQDGAIRRLIANTGVVSSALSERRGQLSSLIGNANAVFETTASSQAALRDALVVLPTFERESRTTLRRLDSFAHDANPVVESLRPAARQLSPTLQSTARLAPDLRGLLVELGPLITAARTGLPATERVLADLRPLLASVHPFVDQLLPVTDYIAAYRRELLAFIVNVTAASQAVTTERGRSTHYLRGTGMVMPESLAVYPRRIGSNRANPYSPPGVFDSFSQKVYDPRACGNSNPTLSPSAPPSTLSTLAEQRTIQGGHPPAPACTPQNLPYPHVVARGR